MASLGDLVVRIVGDNSDFDKKVDASQKKYENFAKSLAATGKKLTTFVTLPLVGIGLAAVKSASDLEMQQAAFETMLGSARDAERLLTDLKDLAARTPFQLSDLADASKTLLSFGVAADDILPTVRKLGDVAGGNGQRFQQLSLAFAQVQATGRLMGQDLLQMINAGFNPLQEISQRTGVSMGELKAQMEKGAISAEMVANAFSTATSEGGRFFGGMERASVTLAGKWSTLMDNMAEMGRGFAQILIPAIKNAIEVVSGIVQRFSAMSDTGKTATLVVLGIVAAIGPLTFGIGKLIPIIHKLTAAITASNMAQLASGIGLAVAAVGLLTVGVIGYVAAARDAKKAQEEWVDALPNISKNLPTAEVIELQRQIVALDNTIKAAEESQSQIAPTREQIARLKAAKDEVAGLRKQLADMGGAVDTRKAGQERFLQAQRELAKALDEVSQREAIAIATGEDYNAVAERRKALLDVIQGLMKEEFRVENANIQALLTGNSELLGAYDRQLKATQEANDAELSRVAILDLEKDATARLVAEGIAAAEEAKRLGEERAAAEKAANDKRVRDEEAANESIKAAGERLVFELIDLAQSLVDRRLELQRQELAALEEKHSQELQLLDETREATEAAHERELRLLDDELQAKLEAAGVAEETKVQHLNSELAAAIAAGDAELVAELQKQIKREEIIQGFELRRAELEKAQAAEEAAARKERADAEIAQQEEVDKQKRKLARDQAISDKAFGLFSVGVNTAVAVAKALTAAIPPFNFILAAIVAAAGVAQAAIIAAKPLPALAAGGIVAPRQGGVPVTVAEGGQPEVVFPLDRLDEFLSRRPSADTAPDGGMVHLQVMIDSKPILDQIFPATRDRRVLIDAGSVV